MIYSRRTATQLKQSWSYIKQRKRKATAELKYKYKRLLTGGGSEPDIDPDPLLDAVDVAAPHADVSLEFPYASTAFYEKNMDNDH